MSDTPDDNTVDLGLPVDFFRTADGSCIFDHGSFENPINLLYGVPVQPIESLPKTCSCGAPFVYADEVAFIGAPVLASEDPNLTISTVVKFLPVELAVPHCEACRIDPPLTPEKACDLIFEYFRLTGSGNHCSAWSKNETLRDKLLLILRALAVSERGGT